MLKLHGMPVSNYYNMVKHCLLEKGMEFEEVSAAPSQEDAYLAKSPMGKIPCLETDSGFLAETTVILDYLEEIHPLPAMYPADPWARAKTREIMRIVEHYIEAPSHRLVGHVLFNAPLSQSARDEIRPAVEKGLAALGRVARFKPYIAGTQLTNADIFSYHSLGLARRMLQSVYQWEIASEVPGLSAWLKLISESPHARAILAAQQQAMAALQAGR